jgi:hypothetical protein
MKERKDIETYDIDLLVDEFATQWRNAESAVRECARVYWEAVSRAGQKAAFERFDRRFGLGKYNFDLLDEIGAGRVDVRVWFLPRHMHGIRNMPPSAQSQLFGTGAITVHKFASEKPKSLELGHMNQSDWRVAFDREKCRIRTSEEMLRYIRGKKREFKNARHWKLGSKKGTVVFDHACTVTKAQLQEILGMLG